MTKALTKPENAERTALETASGRIGSLRAEMDQLFENFFSSRGLSLPMFREDGPRLDLSETNDALEVKTDLPGYKPEEIQLQVRDGHLTISGHHTEEKREEDKDKRFHRVERSTGSFSRSVWLPAPVDDAKIDAQLKDGVLTILLPKTAEAKRKTIPVRG